MGVHYIIVAVHSDGSVFCLLCSTRQFTVPNSWTIKVKDASLVGCDTSLLHKYFLMS